jgi:fatty-acyl-CoA synthase
MASLIDALDSRAQLDSTWITFHHGSTETRWTAAAIQERAQGWAGAFTRHGLQPGDRVGVWQPNGVDFIAAFFGAIGAGGVAVPLPWPVAETATDQGIERLGPLLRQAGIQHLALPEGVRGATGVKHNICHPELGKGALHSCTQNGPAFIQFTSGSTATPRGAVISHAAALENAGSIVRALGLGEGDVGVSWLPLFHDMGLVGVMLSSLLGGFHLHLMRPAEFLLHPRRWLELISAKKATLTVAPDFGYAYAARRVPMSAPFSLSSLRIALTGSEPIQPRTLDAFAERFRPSGFRKEAFWGAYGLAENTLAVSLGPACEATYRASGGRAVPSVGRPVGDVELAVDAPAGEEGPIRLRSSSLMDGYFEAPEATREVLRDGWLHTGDRGVWVDGRLFVTGRDKDLVIKAGRKFHPSEIEQVVAACVDTTPNGVAAFSTPGEGGEELVVVVEPRRVASQQFEGAVRTAVVTELGVKIDRLEWVTPGALPRTSSGKLKRSECVRLYGAPR